MEQTTYRAGKLTLRPRRYGTKLDGHLAIAPEVQSVDPHAPCSGDGERILCLSVCDDVVFFVDAAAARRFARV